MPGAENTLRSLLASNPKFALSLQIDQVVPLAGGDIKDGNDASKELREFLRLVPAENLFEYSRRCLDLTDYGFVLQEIVNELARRLDFDVENGLFKGKPGAIGFDGIWRSPGDPAIVAEVKTTEVYAVSLDTLDKYRRELVTQGRIPKLSSILIVVGREGKGALEAAIRGSEFSRSVRMISLEGLIKLVQINSQADDPDATTIRIRRLLHPVEYIQLDNIIDVIFSTIAGEEEEGQALGPADELADGPKVDPGLIDGKRQQAIDAFSALKGRQLIRRSRTFFWTNDKELRVCCTVSKRYENDARPYFYAYHPKWDTFLGEGQGFLILCCLDRDEAFAVPRTWFADNRQSLYVAGRANGTRWLIWLTTLADGSLAMDLKDGKKYSLEPNKFILQRVRPLGAR